MKRPPPRFRVAAILVLLPGTAFAHSPGGFVLATLCVLVLAACLALIFKRMLASRLLADGNKPRLHAYVGVAVMEFCIMLAALTLAVRVSPSKHSLVILLIGCLFHLVAAFFPNFYLARTATTRSVKAFLMEIAFPVSIWVLIPLLFLPLYILFGG